MDIDNCKVKLKHFRVRELRDVLTQVGLPKSGRKQDLFDKIVDTLNELSSGVSQCTRKKEALVAAINDTYRKLAEGVTNSSARRQNISTSGVLKPPREVSCLCGHSVLTNHKSVQCTNKTCNTWRHDSCVYQSEQLAAKDLNKGQFICELCLIDQADPFWVTISYVVEPVKLEFSANGPIEGSKPFQFVQKEFHLDRASQDLIAKDEYALQAWCVLLADSVPSRIHWPLDAELFVNGNLVRTYSRQSSQKLGANGRDDGARITLDITKGANKISLSCNDDRNFCFGVRLVKRQTLHEVLSMIPDESVGESFEDAVARIKRCIGGGPAPGNEDDCDIEVITDLVTFCLRCPMSGLRMKTAGRFKPCVHMGCFDLEAFVQLNERSRKWQCPICLKNYSLKDLVIDPYFNRIVSMMQHCGEEISEIELKHDGSWRVKNIHSTGDLAKWHYSNGSLMLGDGSLKPTMDENGSGRVSTLEHGLDNTKSNLGSTEWLGQRENPPLNVDPEVIEMSSTISGDANDDAGTSVNQRPDEVFGNASGDEIEVISVHPPDSKRHKSGNCNLETEVVILIDSDEEAASSPCPRSSSAAPPSYSSGLTSSAPPSYDSGLTSAPLGTSHKLDRAVSEGLMTILKSASSGNRMPFRTGRSEHEGYAHARAHPNRRTVTVPRGQSGQIGRKRSAIDFSIPRGLRSPRTRPSNANIVRSVSKRL